MRKRKCGWEAIRFFFGNEVLDMYLEENKGMKIAVLKLKLYAPWVHSLKEKRMVVKSLLAKLRNKFQVSAAEVEAQDIHQSIVIGAAAIVPHSAQADRLMDEIARFVEENTEAEIVQEERELR